MRTWLNSSPASVCYQMLEQQYGCIINISSINAQKGQFGQPEEIARAVACLAARDAGYITGSDLSINGGQYMY